MSRISADRLAHVARVLRWRCSRSSRSSSSPRVNRGRARRGRSRRPRPSSRAGRARSRNTAASSSVGTTVPAVANGAAASTRGIAVGVDDAGAEPDRRPVALADRPDAHDEAQTAGRHAGLVGMGDDARVAQRRALDGVLAGERRAEQRRSCRRASRRARAGRPPRRRGGGTCRRGRGDDRRSGRRRRRTTPAPRRRRGRGAASSTAPARESWWSKPSCPGTNIRVMTRDGSGCEPLRSRRASSARERGHAARRQAPGVLQRREQRQRRLGALVAVHPVGLEAVEAAAGVRIPHDAGRRRCRRGTTPRRHAPRPSQAAPASTSAARAQASASAATSIGC